MNARILLLAVCLASATAAAAGPRWVHMPTATPGIEAYVDTLTAGRGPLERRKVWMRRELEVADRGAKSDISLFVFNCPEMTYSIKAINRYSAPQAVGPVLFSTSKPDESLKFTDVPPGSITETLFAVACRPRP